MTTPRPVGASTAKTSTWGEPMTFYLPLWRDIFGRSAALPMEEEMPTVAAEICIALIPIDVVIPEDQPYAPPGEPEDWAG
jgi:hypothetical protein